MYFLSVKFSIKSCTHPPRFKLCRFGGGGFDQRDDNGRFNSLLLRLLRTGQPERCHWINTVPDPEREGGTQKGRGRENMTERRNEREGRKELEERWEFLQHNTKIKSLNVRNEGRDGEEVGKSMKFYI